MVDNVFTQFGTTPTLENVIQYYWAGEVTNAPNEKFTHIAIAQSRAQILIHYEGEFNALTLANKTEKQLTVGFYGPSLLHQQYASSSQKAGIFGIQLSPFAIPALFSIPASEVTNQSFALADILGRRSKELEEKIFSAKTGEARAQITSAFFEDRLIGQKNKYRGIEHAVAYMHRMKGQVDIKALIHLSCLSPRQFERNFKELIGFSAQTYLRIIRFESAIQRFTSSNASLTELSLACGYYDQAHFNRDFKLFTGLTPTQYFSIHPPSIE
jgi:AraC-like DNA-binding protein